MGGVLLPKREKLIVAGKYHGKLIREGRLIDEFEDDNLVVNQGLNSLLNIMFNGSTQITSWYMGIFQGNYTPVAGDTASTIASNSTECSAYTAGTRPTWTPAAASSQSISNSGSPATFTFNASNTIYGAFLISSNVINGTAGTLFSGAQFASAKSVVSGDQLVLTYTFNASSV